MLYLADANQGWSVPVPLGRERQEWKAMQIKCDQAVDQFQHVLEDNIHFQSQR